MFPKSCYITLSSKTLVSNQLDSAKVQGKMLQEIRNPRQIKDELPRRWFSDDKMDLIVWIDETKEIAGFQLTYDKPHSEHALTWKSNGVFRHNRVDDGEGRPGKYKGTPLLIPDGMFDANIIANKFIGNSGDIDQQISQFVYEKLLTFSNNESEI